MKKESDAQKDTPDFSLWKAYFSASCLLDEPGPWCQRLDSVLRVVQSPTFRYDGSCHAKKFLLVLAQSTYWLERELFDTSNLYKRANDQTLLPEQRIHLSLLDVGSLLIDKGFPLNQKTLDTIWHDKQSPLHPFVVAYLRQLRARSAWLKQQKTPIPTLERYQQGR